MTRTLQSPWIAVILGAILYLVTMVLLLRPDRLGVPLHGLAEGVASPLPLQPSWNYQNPELEELVLDLRRERDAIQARQQDLAALASRLNVERQEMGVVTQRVARLQLEAERALGRIQDQEVANFRRLAKVYTTMSPEGAARILLEFEEDAVVKILALMKEGDMAPILENMAKVGPGAARRVAEITDRLRLFGQVPTPEKSKSP